MNKDFFLLNENYDLSGSLYNLFTNQEALAHILFWVHERICIFRLQIFLYAKRIKITGIKGNK